ncbi:DUF1877 family protein [Bernardetia sp. OM2101]|uniref:DUF1877 family protein n=1 Tax=Bernardetia sp. OM2101 TaxID=3344876 RepID=UPI0035D05220
MGQSIALYEISKEQFDILAQNPSCFDEKMTEEYQVFENNFEGILFVLQKTISDEYKEVIQEVFYSKDHIGDSIIDYFDSLEGEYDGNSDFKDNAISYLPPKRVNLLNQILNEIDKEYFLSQYNSEELNNNRVYPEIWHDHETTDKAYNKLDIENGFDKLKMIFNEATKNKNYILSFLS